MYTEVTRIRKPDPHVHEGDPNPVHTEVAKMAVFGSDICADLSGSSRASIAFLARADLRLTLPTTISIVLVYALHEYLISHNLPENDVSRVELNTLITPSGTRPQALGSAAVWVPLILTKCVIRSHGHRTRALSPIHFRCIDAFLGIFHLSSRVVLAFHSTTRPMVLRWYVFSNGMNIQ